MTGELRGMRATILRDGTSDYSNGGISARHTRVTVIGPNVPQMFAPTDDAPAVVVGERWT